MELLRSEAPGWDYSAVYDSSSVEDMVLNFNSIVAGKFHRYVPKRIFGGRVNKLSLFMDSPEIKIARTLTSLACRTGKPG